MIYGALFTELTLEKVYHIHKAYGGAPLLEDVGDEYIKEVRSYDEDNEFTPAILSRFTRNGDTDRYYYTLVNNSTEKCKEQYCRYCRYCCVLTEESIHSRRCFMTGEYCSQQENIRYEIEGTTLIIIGYGDMYDFVNTPAPWNDQANTIKTVILKNITK